MDKIDMQILSRLLNDCRESDRQIGMKIGITGGAVSARIRKMLSNEVIKSFSLKIEPPAFGFGVLYIVVTGEDLDKILNQVKLVGEPFFVVPCVGGITVCAIVIKEDMKHKIELAKNLMKDVRVLSIFEAVQSINSDLTKTDLAIIEELMKNPREKIDVIAKNTDFSTKTVTRSIEKLQGNEAIMFSLVYEPTKLKDFIPFAILNWINDDVKKTLKQLNKEFSEYYMQKPFVAKNQIVLFLYSDNIFKLDELMQKVRKTQGVTTADLFIPKKIALLQEWVKNAVKEAERSPTLHLTYQVN